MEEMAVPTPLRPLAPANVIRRLPARRCEPPYDDESPDRPRRPLPGDAVQGTLALSFEWETVPAAASGSILGLVPALGTAPGAPAGRVRPRRARAVEPEGNDELDLARRQPLRTCRDQLPDPRPWANGFVQALIEVLGGFRPLGQLSARIVPSVVTQVIACRTDSAAAPARQRPVVRSIRVSEPMPGAVEVSATVRHGERCRALALRLEGLVFCPALSGPRRAGFRRVVQVCGTVRRPEPSHFSEPGRSAARSGPWPTGLGGSRVSGRCQGLSGGGGWYSSRRASSFHSSSGS